MTPRLTIASSADALLIASALAEAARTAETDVARAHYTELADLARAEYATDFGAMIAHLDTISIRDLKNGNF